LLLASIEVRVDREVGIAFVTIHNERKLNTLNSALMEEFALAVEGLARDETLRATVLSGAGERAFIGGSDVDEMVQLDAISARAFISRVHRCCENQTGQFLPVGWGWRAGASTPLAACEMVGEEGPGDTARSVKHKKRA